MADTSIATDPAGATTGTASAPAPAAPTTSKYKITMKSLDMPEDRKRAVIAMAEAALDSLDMEKDVAESLKRQCDTAYGNTWHCVVGKNFGSYVTHETKNFIYFTIDKLSIMLWKTS